jgi:ADP-ribose pyrophosphatase
MQKAIRPWKTLSRKTILDYSKFLTVEEHAVQLPDGRVIPDWPWVTIPDAVIILAQTIDGRFLAFRQTKYALQGVTLAPVGGMLEQGEAPLAAARRELREETGYEARQWISIGTYVTEPNRGVCTIHLYLARDAYPAADPCSDDLEDQELLLLDRQALQAALFRGEFQAVMWTADVAMALLYIDQQGR